MTTPNASDSFQTKPLPLTLRGVGHLLHLLSKEPWKLDPGELLKAAGRDAKLPPRFPTHIENALEVLCRAFVDEAKLHWFGRANQWDFIVTGLAEWLRLDAYFREHPEIESQALIPPLLVTGLPRSGTTFLHRLLCESPDARPIPFHEHVRPVSQSVFSRLEVKGKFLPWQMTANAYDMDAIHFVRPDEPDECNFSLRIGLHSMVFWSTAYIPSYMHWLLSQNMNEAYRDYRRILLILQSRSPGQRLTLKCPSHAAFLQAIAEEIPEALIVHTHRAPHAVVASEASLILALQATSTHNLESKGSVDTNFEKVATYARRMVEFADTSAGKRVHHVDYRQLLTEPVQVAKEIREGFGLPFEDEHTQRLSKYAHDNRQHKHGKHKYSLQQYGFDIDTIDRRFATYCERFAPWLDDGPSTRT